MESNPILSIIVPVYNVEKYINRCIDSILNQQFSDFELILVDDGSPDNCGQICDDYAKKDSRIRVIHKENGGLGSARNVGIELSRGNYIGFVDSDDWISTDMYAFLIQIALEHKADIVSGSYILTKGSSEHLPKRYTTKTFEGIDKLRFYLELGMKYRISDYPVWNKIYKKDLFKDIRFPERQLFEDMATNFMLINKANKYVTSDKPVYFYFQDGESITRNGFKKQDYDLLLVSNQMLDMSKKIGDSVLVHLSEEKLGRSYFSMLSKIAFYGLKDETIDYRITVSDLTRNLRQNFVTLLKSQMPINRKILMILLCIHINCVAIPSKIIKKFM